MSGTLFVVATPIGNLEDITVRALRVLREVDLVACEDTRRTRALLAHFAIATPTISYHEHNEAARTAGIVARLEAGGTVALVSDAGTPCISDPGYRLVREAAGRGIRIVPVPGVSAVVAALSASGLATDTFLFVGFLPAKRAARRARLAALAGVRDTLVLYEAPHRIGALLEDLRALFGDDREVVVARELTKLHEEFLRGRLGALPERLPAERHRGEFVVLVAGAPPAPAAATGVGGTVREAVAALEVAGVGRMEAVKQVARERGLPKRDVYRETIEGKTGE